MSFVFALAAMFATLTVTEMVRVFAHRLRAVDRPGGRRVHRRPTARLGGLGIYWGFVVAIVLATYGQAFWGAGFVSEDLGVVGMLMGASMLLIVGVMDDVYGLSPTIKLLFEVCAASLLYGFGWRVETIGIPGIGAWAVGPLSYPLTIGWVLLVTNAFNLIDGLDGLACGVALVATLAMCALIGSQGGAIGLIAAAFAGALFGFLWFNLNPALIFMGDAGSLFVGFVLSALALRTGQIVGAEAFPLVPCLLVFVPLLDTCDAIVRRSYAAARSARSPLGFVRLFFRRVFSPDGMHLHHRLVRAGCSTRRAVTLLWGVAAVFAAVGWVMIHDTLAGLVLLFLCGAAGVFGFRRMQALVASSMPRRRASPLVLNPAPEPEVVGDVRNAA